MPFRELQGALECIQHPTPSSVEKEMVSSALEAGRVCSDHRPFYLPERKLRES